MSDYIILINKENRLLRDYIPDELVETQEPTYKKTDKTYINKLQQYVYEEFRKLQNAACEGIRNFC